MQGFFSLFVAATSMHSGAKLATLDAITFSDGKGRLYLPIREVSKILDWQMRGTGKGLRFHGVAVPKSETQTLIDGRSLIAVGWLAKAGAIVRPAAPKGLTVVKDGRRLGKAFYVREGQKRVFVNKKTQMLVAYQGRRTVFRSKVSTGMEGKETPKGIFKADGFKEVVHRSKLYHNAPMPWSVHIVGNIFIHGSKSGPGRSSHGCIRLPVEGPNPARWIYYWIDAGTPVTILGKWPKNAQ